MAVLDDFGLRVGRFLTALPTLTNEEIAELQLDSSGRLIISARVLGGDVASSTDAMINVGAIRHDAESAHTGVADGDYSPLQTDSNGRLKVATVVSVEPSDAEYAHSSAFPNTGETGLFVLTVVDDSGTKVPTNTTGVVTDDFGEFKTTLAGELYVHDTDLLSKLTEIDVSIDTLTHVEDDTHNSGDTGIMPLAVRRDADTSLVDTDGDYAPFQVTAEGYLKVQLKESAVTATLEAPGTEQYTITDALAAAGDGLDTITSAATPFVTVASLAHTSGTAYVYGWQWVCDQNAEARLVTKDTVGGDEITYKVSANSSSIPSVDEHWSESGRIEIPGSANLEVRLQIKKRKAAGGDANGGGSLHIRTIA